MKKIFILATILGVSAAALVAFVKPAEKNVITNNTRQVVETGKWSVDKAHSNVKFTVTHLVVSEVEGSFKLFDGAMENTKADLSDAKVNFTVDVNSINTDNEKRDGHLKSDDFFAA